MDDKPHRPWYSFRWTILLWFVIPAICMMIIGYVHAYLIHYLRH
jgi:hypothetical protein